MRSGGRRPGLYAGQTMGIPYQIEAGTSVVVTPAATTTYRLFSTNQYGRTIKSMTVTVQ